MSIAFGIFIGIAPFWGFQTLIVLFLAIFFKLNKVIAFAFSNVSFPVFIPFIICGSLKIGNYFVRTGKPLLLDTSMTFADIQNNISQYLIGSFVLATIMSILFGLFGYFLLTIFSTFKKKSI